MRMIKAADLFCGGGGFTTGLVMACRELGLGLDMVAVNHWDTAIDTHQSNHPEFRHICASIESLDPRIAVPDGYLDVLLAAPECTHHSSARGGKPINDQKRAPAWLILRWLEILDVQSLIMENVPEFRTWGPIDADGKRIKSKKGVIYQHFLQGIRNLGYDVEERVLCAADYGAATTRKRLFVIATKRGRIAWPEQTHAKDGKGGFKPWRPAREIIDFSIKSSSIFGRKRPLAKKTMDRIFEGLERQGLGPYLVTLRRNMEAGRPISQPVPTLTAGGTHVGLVEPILMHVTHGGRLHDLDKPLKTVTCAKRGELALVEPVLIGQHSGGIARPVTQPVQTVATKGAIGLTETVLVPMYSERQGQAPRSHSVDLPTPTIPATGGGKFGLVQAYIVPHRHWNDGAVDSVERPLRTVTAAAGRNFGLVEPLVVEYKGEPYILDIRFRMLQPPELAAAMDFPKDYVFKGKVKKNGQVRKGDIFIQIGNAVDVVQGQALCKAQLLAMLGTETKLRKTA